MRHASPMTQHCEEKPSLVIAPTLLYFCQSGVPPTYNLCTVCSVICQCCDV